MPMTHYNPSSILTLGDLTMDTLTNSQICTSNKASPESTFTSSKMSCSFYCILSLGYPIEIKLSSWPTHLHYSQTYLFILIFSISVTSNPLLVVQVKSLITPDFSQHTVHKKGAILKIYPESANNFYCYHQITTLCLIIVAP